MIYEIIPLPDVYILRIYKYDLHKKKTYDLRFKTFKEVNEIIKNLIDIN